MNNKTTFNIVCPIYKPLDECDKLSLKSLFDTIAGNKVMCNNIEYTEPKYDVYFIMPAFDSVVGNDVDVPEYYTSLINYINKELHVLYYLKDINNREINGFRVQFMDKDYFKSIYSYSNMLLQDWFYKEWLGLGYKYTYMYQTDCYIFEDKLQEFVDLGFDYIGSPIIATNSDWGQYGCYVGNGGFSLRNNRTFMKILCRDSEHWKNHKDELENTHLPKNTDKKYIDFEDIFICRLLSRYIYINIAPIDIASDFCFDRNSDVLYERCHYNKENKETPMCCHNIINQYNFWKQFIPELESNKKIKEQAKKYQQNWENMYHPEEQGYGN